MAVDNINRSSNYINFSAIDDHDFDNNIIITGAIRSGKTEKAIKRVVELVKSKKKVIYICRSHEQCKDVAQRFDMKGIKVLHLSGKKYKNMDYVLEKGVNPNQLYRLLKENKKIKNKLKESEISTKIVEIVEEMLLFDDVDVIITVPEMAIKLHPQDVLVFDELTTIGWFLPKPVLIREFVNIPTQGYESKLCRIKQLINFLKQNSDDYEWLTELDRTLDSFIEIYEQKRKKNKKKTIEHHRS